MLACIAIVDAGFIDHGDAGFIDHYADYIDHYDADLIPPLFYYSILLWNDRKR